MDNIKAKELVLAFITEMNNWERRCNEIDDDETLNDDDQFKEQKKLVTSILTNTVHLKKEKRVFQILFHMDLMTIMNMIPKKKKL